MFITYPLNIDYLIPDVRIRAGDITDPPLYSDTLVRTAIVAGVKYLQRRWENRYLVFASGMVVIPQPIGVPAGYVYAALPQGFGYIPSGLLYGDVFRNPYHTFANPGTWPISQEDESVITTAAVLILMRSIMSSSSTAFVNWSDGEYSYSNVATSSVLRDLYRSSLDELDLYFKRRLATPIRADFPELLI